MGNENKKSCSPNEDEVTCPRNHQLKLFITDHYDFACDICHKSTPKDTEMWGCRSCNWDSCVDCHQGRKRKRLDSVEDRLINIDEEKANVLPRETQRKDESTLPTVNIMKIPTTSQINKFRKPIKVRIGFWMSALNTKRATQKIKRSLSLRSKKKLIIKEESKEQPWRVGDKAWSQILNGPNSGKWVRIVVKRVDKETGLLDISIPNHKRHRVFSSACKVSPDYLKRKPPANANIPYATGEQAWSKILTGDSVGVWIKVIIRRVHNDDKVDIFIPSFKKYKVYAHALEVPLSLVLRKPPLNALREGDSKESSPSPPHEPQVLPNSKAPGEKFTLHSVGSTYEDPATYRDTQAKIQAAVNKALGFHSIAGSLGDFEPDFSQFSASRSDDDDDDEEEDEYDEEEEEDEFNEDETPANNFTTLGKPFPADFGLEAAKLEFDNDQECEAYERMGAVVGFLMNIDTDEKSSRAQELTRLWNALDLDHDGKLDDGEILNMQLAIAEAWKQKAQIEFDEMLNKMDNPMNNITKAQLVSVTSQFKQEMLQDLEDRKKDILENKERYIEELRFELDIDMDGVVSKDDFLKTAPFVLYDQN